jgi:hypothetical protein
MNKTYLIVVNVDNQYYLQVQETVQGEFGFKAYEKIEQGVNIFESIKDKIHSEFYEPYIIISMGIMDLRPHIIQIDKDKPESLRKYIIDDRLYKIHCGDLDEHLNIIGLKVSDDILNLSVYDISKNFTWDFQNKTS